ncbi:MAG: Ig-like domain-containing protein [Hormoscilla sp. GM7CHS1pb]|nr:Ig-like domain-containing protein [Hormoscilla sp. GM7CHS1pb]
MVAYLESIGNQTTDPNPPIAVDDFAITSENAPVSIPVLNNDSDPDGDVISLSDFTSITGSGGTLSINNGELVYTPAFGFAGTGSVSCWKTCLLERSSLPGVLEMKAGASLL